LGLLRGADNKAFSEKTVDAQGKETYIPKLSVQFYGTPSYTNNLGTAAINAGANIAKVQIGIDKNGEAIFDYSLGHIINPGDAVPNILGGNSFLPGNASATELGRSLVAIPSIIGIYGNSPHSNYRPNNSSTNSVATPPQINQNSQ
jgi:hypothetical protein